jgi:putative ABC transport system permease protein
MFPQGKFFDKPINAGKKLEIEGKIFEVAGTVSQIGNPSDDSQIYMPLETAQNMLDKKDSYDLIIAQSGPGADTTAVAEKIKDNLRRDRDIKVGEEDFSVETSEQLITTFNSVLGILLIAVVGIASISLLVGGVGIMNTMYTSVLDRTQEIGVLKAIGATDEDVMSVFVIESGLLGLIGGLIGVLLGTALSYVIQYIATVVLLTKLVQVYLDPLMLFGILAFSFIIGCISGLLPARRAAKMRPAEALRYE